MKQTALPLCLFGALGAAAPVFTQSVSPNQMAESETLSPNAIPPPTY